MEFNLTLVTWINSKEHNLTIIDFEFDYSRADKYLVCGLSIFPVGDKWRSLFRIGYDNVYRKKRKFRLHLLWMII